MIRGVHTMFYTSEPEALRAFLRDKLGFPASDVGGGWLIFDLPEADMGCHPADAKGGKPSGTPDISFYCDDIDAAVADLRARGVEFTGPIANHGYGLVTHFLMPGNLRASPSNETLYRSCTTSNPRAGAAAAGRPKAAPRRSPPSQATNAARRKTTRAERAIVLA